MAGELLAYVLVKVAIGMEREALGTLQGLENVEELDFLFGEYDYLLKMRAPDIHALSRLVWTRIRRTPGVARTITLIEAPA